MIRVVDIVEDQRKKLQLLLEGASREPLQEGRLCQQANRKHLQSLGVLGAEAVNFTLEKYAFGDTPVSLRTAIADGVAPLVAMTSSHWSMKAGVGTHIASRLRHQSENRRK